MFTVDQKINSLRMIIHLFVFIIFTNMLNEWSLGLAVSVFSRCYISKIAEKSYYFVRTLITSE